LADARGAASLIEDGHPAAFLDRVLMETKLPARDSMRFRALTPGISGGWMMLLWGNLN